MAANYSLSMMTEAELKVRISDYNKTLAELAPYSGTVPVARAVFDARYNRDMAVKELQKRYHD